MPEGLVKTKAEEKLWEKAKEKAHKEYSKLSEDDDEFWKIVVSIFKNMKGESEQKDTVDGVIGRIYGKLLILNTVMKLDAAINRNIR